MLARLSWSGGAPGRSRLGAVTAALLLASAMQGGPALAQEAPTAFGRITYGDTHRRGTAICSGTLVAPDLVLTAAHCVRSMAETPGAIRFAAEYDRGRIRAAGRGREILFADVPEGATSPIAGDMALIVLEAPMRAEGLSPLAIAAPKGERFSLFTYRSDDPEVAERTDSCDWLASSPGVMGMTCEVVSGNSGAGVLEWTGKEWVLVAVLVARDGPPIRSWAVIPEGDFAARIRAPGPLRPGPDSGGP